MPARAAVALALAGAQPHADALSLQNVSYVATAVTAVVAFVAVFSYRAIRRQVVAANASSASQAYAAVAEQMSRMHDLLLRGDGKWIAYFYEDKPSPWKEGDKRQLDLICEAQMDLVDVVTEQRRAARGLSPMDWSTWDAYFRYLYNCSPVLRAFVPENRDFYPDYLFAALGYIIVRRRLTGEVTGTWHAREFGPGDGPHRRMFGPAEQRHVGVEGYPWVRTWVIEPAQGRKKRGPVLVAAVEMSGARTARVHVRSRAVDADARATMWFWLLDLLEASGAVEHVAIHTDRGRPTATFRLGARLPRAQRGLVHGLPRYKQLRRRGQPPVYEQLR